MYPTEKLGPSRLGFQFQGHSRSAELSWTDRVSVTFINVPYGPNLYRL